MDKTNIKTLGEVATYINGRAFKPTEWEEAGLPIIRIQNLTNSKTAFHYSSQIHEEKYRVKKGDLLFAWSASLGAHIWKKDDAWLNQHIFRVIPNEDVSKEYLYYYLSKVTAELYSKTHGSGMVHITKAPFMATPIPVPPLEEQQRIVARIEELFSELDAAVATLERTKEQLAVYRQAVLKEAFAGCNAWNSCKFSDVLINMRNGYGKKPSDMGTFKILKISAVRPLFLDLTECRYNSTPFQIEDTISPNDILFTRYNGSKEYVGVCAVVPSLSEEYGYPDKIIKCTPKIQNPVHSKYLAYYLSQGNAREYLRSKIKTTSGQNGISGTDIKNTIIYIPDISLQKKIVSEIESRLSVCDKIEETVNTALQEAEAMRQSILKQAFAGELN